MRSEMSTSGGPDAFKLGRLRLVRLPPARLHLDPPSRRTPQTVPGAPDSRSSWLIDQKRELTPPSCPAVELATAVTDDYGVDLEFDELHRASQPLKALVRPS